MARAKERITRTDGIDQGLGMCSQTISTKQGEKKDIRLRRVTILSRVRRLLRAADAA